MDSQTKAVWQHLNEVMDPEIPAVNVVEMGIVRNVKIVADTVEVTITPTYSGCPAMSTITNDIVEKLNAEGYDKVKIVTVYAPAWTTDWLTDEAKAKLKASGIAPPCIKSADNPSPFAEKLHVVPCPHCESKETKRQSEFGSTACKALYVCKQCKQPFDYFKPF